MPHIWSHWHIDPLMLAGLALISAGYLIGIRKLWRRAGPSHGIHRGEAWSFAAGIGVLGVASMSPIHEVGEHLFSVHMAQHLLIILGAAPLLISGSPQVALVWSLHRSTRKALGRWWHRARIVRESATLLTTPLVAWAVQAGILWFWHLPAAYLAALGSPLLHGVEHFTLLASALLFWWVLLQPAGRHRLAGGMQVLYLVGASVQSGMLGALLTFAGNPLYGGNWFDPGGLNLTRLEDQQLAGLLMWLPGGLVYLLAASWTFVRWLTDQNLKQAIPEVAGATSNC